MVITHVIKKGTTCGNRTRKKWERLIAIAKWERLMTNITPVRIGSAKGNSTITKIGSVFFE